MSSHHPSSNTAPVDVSPPASDVGDTAGRAAHQRATRVWLAAAVAAVVLTVALAALVPRIRLVPTDGSAEAGFARDMSTHHAQAVGMAELLRDRTDDAELRVLAADIAATQQAQIGRMHGWLDVWGLRAFSAEPMAWMADAGTAEEMADGGSTSGMRMPGMATPEELARLRAARGRAAEILFLQLMIEHHRGGIAMADAVLRRADHDEVRRLARAMVTSQRSEIDYMRDLLRSRQSATPDPSRAAVRGGTGAVALARTSRAASWGASSSS